MTTESIIETKWKKVQLNELTILITKGTTPTTLGMNFSQEGINFIKSESVTKQGTIDNSKFVFIDENTHKTLRRSHILENDLLLSIAGMFLGKVAVVPSSYIPANTNQALAIIRLNKQVANCHFIGYFLRNPSFNRYMNNLVAQSAQPNLNLKQIAELPIQIPPLEKQKQIAKILLDLDTKIQNLQNQNHTLEQTAQAIFKSWFVDFDGVKEFEDSELGKIPKQWTISTLSNLTSFDIGGTWGKEISDKDFNSPSFCIRGKNIPEIINGDDSKTLFLYGKKSIQEKRKLLPHDIVIEISGGSSTQLTGRSLLITERLLGRFQFPLLPASFCKLIRFEDKKFSFFVYLLLRFIYDIGEINQYATGTTAIKNFQYTIFSNDYKFALPHNTILEKFNQMIQSIFNIMDNNIIQIQKLVKTRDILLPKLMSGEIRV